MSEHWCYRKTSIKLLCYIGITTLFIVLLAERWIDLHPHFQIAKIFGFHALYGFFACVGMVIISKLLAYMIKRREDYYDH